MRTTKLNGIMLAMVLAGQVHAISVDFYDEQQNNSSMTGIRLRINNDSNAPIANAKVRYYFHRSSSAPYAVDSYYIAGATMTVNDVNSELAYVELSVPSVPVGYYPDMAGFSLALHDESWGAWNKGLDYSYQLTSTMLENAKVVLLSGDDVIFGEAPDAVVVPETGKLKISGIRFSENAWIEIKNVSNVDAVLADYQLVNTNGDVFALGTGTLAAGEVLRICENQAACANFTNALVVPNFGWDDVGEAILKKDASMVSYVAWGEAGANASDASNAGLWNDPMDYFHAEEQSQVYGLSYTKNAFFRLKAKKSGAKMEDWFSFTSNDSPVESASSPNPIKLSANKPVIKYIPGDNGVLFSWVPVENTESYRIVIFDANQNVVYDEVTQETAVSVPLAQGNYSWAVYGSDSFNDDSRCPEVNGVMRCHALEHIGIEQANINTNIYKKLDVEEIAARRDTRLLDLAWLGDTPKHSWDRPNLDAANYDAHEANRCWAVAIELMNHYYGGNLTQDEIVFKAKFKKDEPLLSALDMEGGVMTVDPVTKELVLDPVSGDPIGDLPETMKWALKVDRLNYGAGAPSYATVKNAIDNNRLVYVGIPQHAMVIYGYVGDASNYAFYYAFVSNNGIFGNSLIEDTPITEYFIPDVQYGNVEMSDYRVGYDSDSDGITNFDEIYRFNTDPSNADSDNDGIEDKREIFEYTWKANDGCFNCGPLKDIQAKADKNKNDVRAEHDPDDDGDGIEDGLKGKDMVVTMDVPGDYTIFGREYVTINDNAKCYDTPYESNSYCNLASSDENKFAYNISYRPITIGARAHVGNVDFYNMPFNSAFPGEHRTSMLRNSSVVHGDVNIYGVSMGYLIQHMEEYKAIGDMDAFLSTVDPTEYLSRQNNAVVEGSVNMKNQSAWTQEYTYAYSSEMPEIPDSKVKVVRNGETYHLKDGDEFYNLRVESGATLIIEPGEMFVYHTFQIEPNSTVRFAEPGKGTVLHTNGSIIWRNYKSEPATNTQYWTNVAKGFKLAHHSSKAVYFEGMWAGTIFAPKAKIIMGQTVKTIYGRILGRDVVVHQFAKIFRVDFAPTDVMQIAYLAD